MEEKVKKSIISAVIMGILIPTSSLLYVRREGLALGLMSFFACATAALIYTPVVYFATSLFIFIIIQIGIWVYSFSLGVWQVCKGVSVLKNTQDQGPWLSAYMLLILFIVAMFGNLSVEFFVTRSAYLDFGKNDVIVVRKNPEFKYLNVLDYVVFLDEDYNKALGQVIALPGDVLKYEDGKISRNDQPYEISVNLPAQTWIVPEDIVLIHCSSYGVAKSDILQEKHELEKNEDNTNTKNQAIILPMERLTGKALYVLWSAKLSNIGRNLSRSTVF